VSPQSSSASNNEYFNNINFSPATPPRVPPKTNVRAPVLHRLSETDSLEEAASIDPVPPGPRFRGPSNGSPVSPYTVLEQDIALPVPTAFDLDKSSGSGRKGSESSTTTQSTQRSRTRHVRGNSLGFDDDGEPIPFVMRSSDKHKRILGIDSKAPPIKQPPRTDSAGNRRKRSLPEPNDRSNSPLPAPDIVPFVYQDIEVCHYCDKVDP
jgi:hypothetical protein